MSLKIKLIQYSNNKQINQASIETKRIVLLMVIGQLNADTVAVTKRLDHLVDV